MRAIVLLTLCLLSLRVTTLAGDISGKVRSESGIAVAGATIQAYQGKSLRKTAKSDKNGTYQIRGLEAGSYRLRFSAPDMKPYTQTVNVGAAGTVATVSVRLSFDTKMEPLVQHYS